MFVQAELKNQAEKMRLLQVTLTDREAELVANGKLIDSLQTSNKELSKNLSETTRQEQVNEWCKGGGGRGFLSFQADAPEYGGSTNK